MKIESITFGYGSYQGSMLGVSVIFSDDNFGVGTFMGTWGLRIARSTVATWSEEDRDRIFLATIYALDLVMYQANVRELDQLRGKPVLAEFSSPEWDGSLRRWRIFHEVA